MYVMIYIYTYNGQYAVSSFLIFNIPMHVHKSRCSDDLTVLTSSQRVCSDQKQCNFIFYKQQMRPLLEHNTSANCRKSMN